MGVKTQHNKEHFWLVYIKQHKADVKTPWEEVLLEERAWVISKPTLPVFTQMASTTTAHFPKSKQQQSLVDNCSKVNTSKASPVNSLPQNSHLTLRLGQSCCRCSGRSRRVSLTLQRLGHGITLNAQVEKWLYGRKQSISRFSAHCILSFQSHKKTGAHSNSNTEHYCTCKCNWDTSRGQGTNRSRNKKKGSTLILFKNTSVDKLEKNKREIHKSRAVNWPAAASFGQSSGSLPHCGCSG